MSDPSLANLTELPDKSVVIDHTDTAWIKDTELGWDDRVWWSTGSEIPSTAAEVHSWGPLTVLRKPQERPQKTTGEQMSLHQDILNAVNQCIGAQAIWISAVNNPNATPRYIETVGESYTAACHHLDALLSSLKHFEESSRRGTAGTEAR